MASTSALNAAILDELQTLAPSITERYWWSTGRRIGDGGYRICAHPFKDDFDARPRHPVANRAFWRGILEGCARFHFSEYRNGKVRGAAYIKIEGRPDFRWYMFDSIYFDFPSWDRENMRDNSVIRSCSTPSTVIPSKLVKDLINLVFPTGSEFTAKETFRLSIESVRAYSPNNVDSRRRGKAKMLGIPMATIDATLKPDLGPRPDFSMYRPQFEGSPL